VDIVFNNVSKTYLSRSGGGSRAIQALLPLDLTIGSGEFLSVIGPSGCGKSTLMNLLAGLEVSDTGSVEVGGRRVTQPGPDRAVVFQEAGLMPWMTVRANVEYGLKLAGVDKETRRERAMKYLRMVHLARFADSLPHQLSGGMRQRVAIARGLALEPAALLMDEPFSALDAQTRDLLHEELQRIWQETGVTVFFVTHNLQEAVYLSDRVLVMTASPGRIKSVIRVPFSRPRRKDSAELSAFAAHLHKDLREEVNRVAEGELDEQWKDDRVVPAPASSATLGDGI
jgi:NitT/TauT family transport system ATP-binding protein